MRKFTLNDGLTYIFEKWENKEGVSALVVFYTKNGESFGIWTSETYLPENQEEAQEMIYDNDLDWQVENMTFLYDNGFKKHNR
jgi:hypothetical protein